MWLTVEIQINKLQVTTSCLTIPKWYNTCILKIFLEIFFGQNILKNIFNTQVINHFGFMRPNASIWKNIFFKIQTVFAVRGGGNFQKKICVSKSFSNVSKNGPSMVVSLNFDITIYQNRLSLTFDFTAPSDRTTRLSVEDWTKTAPSSVSCKWDMSKFKFS